MLILGAVYGGSGLIGLAIGYGAQKRRDAEDAQWDKFEKELKSKNDSYGYKAAIAKYGTYNKKVSDLSELIEQVETQSNKTSLSKDLQDKIREALGIAAGETTLDRKTALFLLGEALEDAHRNERFYCEKLDLGFQHWKKTGGQYICELPEDQYRSVMKKDNVDYSSSEPLKGYSGEWKNPYPKPQGFSPPGGGGAGATPPNHVNSNVNNIVIGQRVNDAISANIQQLSNTNPQYNNTGNGISKQNHSS